MDFLFAVLEVFLEFEFGGFIRGRAEINRHNTVTSPIGVVTSPIG
jgi:hypothetical protein